MPAVDRMAASDSWPQRLALKRRSIPAFRSIVGGLRHVGRCRRPQGRALHTASARPMERATSGAVRHP
ncbi:hypothetical protein QJS66_22975 [Kocuria rhizophila]|nr:hypothetical protein QJS66_22975 [Kocuria rhizophila]